MIGGRSLRYRLRLALREPTTLVGILMAALFLYLILVPILSILADAVTVQPRRRASHQGR